jgi:DNA-binding CsgD family transcriptional regulator
MEPLLRLISLATAGVSQPDRGWPPAQAVEQLRELFDNCAGVRRDNRELLRELRSNIGELREQRTRLSGNRRVLLPTVRTDAEPSRTERLRTRFGLTGRELEVAALLSDGRSNAAIAAALGISPHTARHHTQRVLGKLGVHSRAEAGARLRG